MYNSPSLVDIIKEINRRTVDDISVGTVVTAPESQDLTISGVTANVTYYVEPLTGIGRTRVVISWTALPPLSPDFIYTDALDHYKVRILLGGATDAVWQNTLTNSITFENLPLNTAAVAEVKAVSTSGRESTSAGTYSFNTSKDTTPPSQTSTPVVSAALKAVVVQWDGLDSTGSAMPIDLAYVEVHMDTSGPTFTPSSSTYIDRIDVGGGKITIPAAAYVPMYVRFVSVDSSGNKGPVSAAGSATPAKAVDTDAGFALPGDIAYRDEGNLIPDGSFESAIVTSYRDGFSKTASNPSWDTTGGVPYAGTRAMKFVGDAVTSKFWYLTGTNVAAASVVAGTQLYVAMRAKGISANGSVYIQIRWTDTSGTQTTAAFAAQNTSTGAWVLSEAVATVPANVVLAEFAVYTLNQTTGTWWVDTVQCRNIIGTTLIADAAITNAKIGSLAVDDAKISTLSGSKILAQTISTEKLSLGVLSTNLVLDPGFEDNYSFNARGDYGWWTAAASGSSSATKRMPYGRSGQYACKLNVGVANDWVNISSNVFTLTPGALYKIVAYAAPVSGAPWVSLQIGHGATVGSITWTEVTNLTLTGPTDLAPDSYVKLSADYTVPAGHVVGQVRVLLSTVATSACQVDDISCMQQGQGGAAELTASGLRLFDNTGEEVSAFVSNRPNYFSVTQNDQVLASINGAGAIYGQNLNIANDPIFQGQGLQAMFNSRGKGTVFFAVGGAFTDTACTSEIGFGEIAFTPVVGRQYKLTWHPPMVYVNTSTAVAGLMVRYTTNGAIPTITSTYLQQQQLHLSAISYFQTPPNITVFFNVTSTPTNPWRFLGSIARLSGTGSLFARAAATDYSPQWWQIEDVGPVSLYANQVIAANTGGGTGTPPTQNYERTYGVSSWNSYGASGSIHTPADHAYQGYYSSVWGNQYSRMVFDPAIDTDLSGATINGAWLYFECQHTYAGSGAPSIVVRGDGASVGSGNVVAGGAYEYGIPGGALPGVGNRTYGFGQAPNNSQTYYAYYNPTTMRLRVNYTK